MSHYTVTRVAGPAWREGGIAEQPALSNHAAFMNMLADDGFVLFAGPLGGTEQGRLRALLIVDAESGAEIHRRLAGVPWTRSQQLEVTSIEPWNIFVGAERLSPPHTLPTRPHEHGPWHRVRDARDRVPQSAKEPAAPP